MLSLHRDGIRLCYESAGLDGPALVLVHGWCCDHTYFAPQIAYFAKRGYRVIAVDLRGHGQSDQPEQAYSMQVFADDVAWLCGQLGVPRAYFVGHSMGGNIAFELAVRRPDLVAGIVMIDSAIARSEGARAATGPFLEKIQGEGYREAMAAYVTNVLALPTDDKTRLDDIIARMGSAPKHVMLAAFEGLREYDPAASGRIVCPALFIAADEPQARCDMTRLRELVPALAYGQTVGSGHFCQLEVSDQVNPMIERFLALQTR